MLGFSKDGDAASELSGSQTGINGGNAQSINDRASNRSRDDVDEDIDEEEEPDQIEEPIDLNKPNIVDDDDDLDQDYPMQVRGRRGAKKKGFLKDDLIKMMQGFGEINEPRDDTLELMEAYVFEFINNIVHRSLQRSQRAGFAQI